MGTAKGSLRNLNWLIFLIASMQAGVGAFVPVHLTAGDWDPRAIGAVLSAGTIAVVAAQIPSGAVIDHFPSKLGGWPRAPVRCNAQCSIVLCTN